MSEAIDRRLDPTTVLIDHLCREVQARQALRDKIVGEYAEAMRAGDQFPPIVVYHDGQTNWLADGHHRVEAVRRAGRTEIVAEVRSGDRRDALLHAIQANTRHGVGRQHKLTP
jgi:ParB-like chromosome segregation protein Spo0J